MRYDDRWWEWCFTGEGCKGEDEGLDSVELSRAGHLAEHPELIDPLIVSLPERFGRRGGGRG